MNSAFTEPLLRVDQLSVQYGSAGILPGKKRPLKAVSEVSLQVGRGETFALVGESGCGKSSLARAVVALERPAAGRVVFDGNDLHALSRGALHQQRRRVQLVHQNPYASFDPRRTLEQSISEPLEIYRVADRAGRRNRVQAMLKRVGLGSDFLDRLPHQLSGGQLQRASIARAFVLEPELVVLDEPVSALDVSVQAQVVNLLRELRDETGTSFLVIAHDLAVVRHLADVVGVMYLGRLVEVGSRDQVYGAPQHPYTRSLLASVPVPDPEVARARRSTPLAGDPPDPRNPPEGCAFSSRCPLRAQLGDPQLCVTDRPLLQGKEGHRAACHFVDTPAITAFPQGASA